jgi:hypothetical protein
MANFDELARAIPDYQAVFASSLYFADTDEFEATFPEYCRLVVEFTEDADERYIDFLLRNGQSPTEVLEMGLPPLLAGGPMICFYPNTCRRILSNLLQKGARPPCWLAKSLFDCTFDRSDMATEFALLDNKSALLEVFAAHGYFKPQLKQLFEITALPCVLSMKATTPATTERFLQCLKGRLQCPCRWLPQVDFSEPSRFDLRSWVLAARKS